MSIEEKLKPAKSKYTGRQKHLQQPEFIDTEVEVFDFSFG
jgi:hypothetical protein